MENDKHLHKCMFPYHDSEGCGHIWEHKSNLDATYEEYVAAHTCPKCQRVMPMYADHFWQYAPEVQREIEAGMPEEAFELIALMKV